MSGGLKGLAAQLFAKQQIAKEFDPESEIPIDDDDSQNGGLGSDSDESGEENTRDTEHYTAVGKSKLRQKQPLSLGPAYRGKRVSRHQLEESSEELEDEDDGDGDGDGDGDSFDDPEEVDLEGAEEIDSEDEIDSDDAFGTDDEELVKMFTFRGSSKPKVPSAKLDGDEGDEEDEDDESGDEDDEDDELGDEEKEEEEESDSNGGSDDDTDPEEEDNDESAGAGTDTQADLRNLLAQGRQQVLSSISQSAKADVQKGLAVRQQRRAFDALLNMRIRMQKALAASNSLHTIGKGDSDGIDSDAVEEVASKAFELLQSIQSIQQAFYGAGGAQASPSTKRKRTGGDEGDRERSCQAIFDDMVQAEEAASAKRKRVLDRWSQRVQRPSASSSGAASRRFMASSAQQPLTTVLDSQLVAPDRLIRRTRTPRSCAPVQAAKRVDEDSEIYDDADFYQLLLKELVDQRTVDSNAPGSTAPTVRWATAAVKEAKTRKQVDRKASKGRKMRFNVHEKLQNFMAPEDRRGWEPEAIDRFFSTLFGQRLELREGDDAETDEDDDQNGGASLEEEGLRLFQN